MVSKTLMIALVAVVIVIIAGAAIYLAYQPAPIVEKLKVAVLMPGSITDAGWNSAMYTGATALRQKLNNTVQIDLAEGLGQVGVEPTMRDYCGRGFNIIVGWTIQYTEPASLVAHDYPDVAFFVTSCWLANANLVDVETVQWDGAFLAGIIAGAITNSNIVGAVAGYNYPSTAAVPNAFFLGAKYVNPGITTLPTVFAGVWDDVNKGRESGEALISQGADVLLSRGDGLTLGVIQAASAHYGPDDTVYMIGDMADQHALAPKTIITSNMYLCEPALENM
ncbi:MAG TPA: BMP family protein, partial [Candidatus Bathyarchaeia archaeon]|nr:BMP family protein [Candidatus Bathyarchaeia archaeon]